MQADDGAMRELERKLASASRQVDASAEGLRTLTGGAFKRLDEHASAIQKLSMVRSPRSKLRQGRLADLAVIELGHSNGVIGSCPVMQLYFLSVHSFSKHSCDAITMPLSISACPAWASKHSHRWRASHFLLDPFTL